VMTTRCSVSVGCLIVRSGQLLGCGLETLIAT
jgi:pyrimidine deaminase RibD-like protein